MDVDTDLVRLSADHEALSRRGARIARFNLSTHPTAFLASALVRVALQQEGTACLPLVVVDGEIVSRGSYPAREQLEVWAGLSPTGGA